MGGNGSSRGLNNAEGRKGMKGQVNPKPIEKINTNAESYVTWKGFSKMPQVHKIWLLLSR